MPISSYKIILINIITYLNVFPFKVKGDSRILEFMNFHEDFFFLSLSNSNRSYSMLPKGSCLRELLGSLHVEIQPHRKRLQIRESYISKLQMILLILYNKCFCESLRKCKVWLYKVWFWWRVNKIMCTLTYVMWGSLTNGIDFLAKSIFALLSWVNSFLKVYLVSKDPNSKNMQNQRHSKLNKKGNIIKNCIKLVQISYYLKQRVWRMRLLR